MSIKFKRVFPLVALVLVRSGCSTAGAALKETREETDEAEWQVSYANQTKRSWYQAQQSAPNKQYGINKKEGAMKKGLPESRAVPNVREGAIKRV